MIGRGLMSRPDLALEIKFGRSVFDWTALQDEIAAFTQASFDYRGDSYAVGRTKQILKSICRARPEALILFDEIKRLETIPEMLERLSKLKVHRPSIGEMYGYCRHLHKKQLPLLCCR